MPRPKFKRLPCDCWDCADPERLGQRDALGLRQPSADASELVAQLNPPPKCLILYLESCLQRDAQVEDTLRATEHPHLDGVARDGACGWLSMRRSAAHDNTCGLAHLSQLLGVHEEYEADGPQLRAPPLADRYQHLSTALASDDTAVRQLGVRAGVARVLPLSHPGAAAAGSDGGAALADVAATAQLAARELGVRPIAAPSPALEAVKGHAGDGAGQGGEGGEAGDDGCDLLLMHLACTPPSNGIASACHAAACEALQWLDALVAALNAVPGMREGVLLVLLLGSAGLALPRPGCEVVRPLLPRWSRDALEACGAERLADYPPVRRPAQSHEVQQERAVDVWDGGFVLTAARLPGVVRRDTTRALQLDTAVDGGGNRCILAERLLPELAFKLGRAPKYGA